MIILRTVWMAALVFGLTACHAKDMIRDPTDIGKFFKGVYVENGAEVVAAADWSKAETVSIRIRQSEFDPMLVNLKKDQPYVLRFENADKVEHSFLAVEFFETIAPKQLTPGEEVTPDSVLVSISIPAEESRELHFVPTVDGRYEFEDGSPGFFLHRLHFAPFSRGTFGAAGVIKVN